MAERVAHVARERLGLRRRREHALEVTAALVQLAGHPPAARISGLRRKKSVAGHGRVRQAFLARKAQDVIEFGAGRA